VTTATKLLKGNDAAVCGALLAGCEAFYGYPITPASEIAHTAALLFPMASRTFIQAESEIAAINMVYGASAAGVRCLTASSGPGISLKMEGLSYLASAELPAVIINVSRVGPGLGNVYPSQGDYNQMVKGGGHGSYRSVVLAPNSVQEMCDFTVLAFELADSYRMPVIILSDACVGQMMEPVRLPPLSPEPPPRPWALTPDPSTSNNVITSIFLDPDEMEAHVTHLQDKYAEIRRHEALCEHYATDDAEIALVGFGIVSRLLRALVERARAEGIKVGLFRPQTLWPFPRAELLELAERVKSFLVVELSNGQMVDDVQRIVANRRPVEFLNRLGGNMPETEVMIAKIRDMVDRKGRGTGSPEKKAAPR
jgi:2-oxoisovalerate ferredoxin oxidoreductase alpha subunit